MAHVFIAISLPICLLCFETSAYSIQIFVQIICVSVTGSLCASRYLVSLGVQLSSDKIQATQKKFMWIFYWNCASEQ